MEHVIDALNAILEETRFNFSYREYTQFSPADGLRGGTLRDAYRASIWMTGQRWDGRPLPGGIELCHGGVNFD